MRIQPISPFRVISGDRVICFEWFGDGPPPLPKWHCNMRAGFSPEEESYIERGLQQIVSVSLPIAAADHPWLAKMPDSELLHTIWGVTP
jgi:hypothetical protein